MLSRETAISILKEYQTEDNSKVIEFYMDKISNKTSDEAWQEILENKGIKDIENLKRLVVGTLEEHKKQHEFIEVNDLVKYGKTDTTIHIHLVPEDAKNLLSREGLYESELELIDALEKLREIVKEDDKIEQVCGVSGLIKRPISDIFYNLGFDVKSMRIEEAKEDEELKRFYETFKDKKSLGRASIKREELLSKEWDERKEERKNILEKLLEDREEI